MGSQATFHSSGGSFQSSRSGPTTSSFSRWITRWLTLILCSLLYIVLAVIEYRSESPRHRILVVALYLAAAALGIAIGHSLIKQSMKKAKGMLRLAVNQYLDELRDQARQESKKSDSILLPIPYIVSRLRDGSDNDFGYFGGKLMTRDPRLLLDLALDQALPGGDRTIWELTQEIKVAQKEASSTAVGSAETVARNVTETVFSRLRSEVEAAVSEALKKAQEESKKNPGGPHGESS